MCQPAANTICLQRSKLKLGLWNRQRNCTDLDKLNMQGTRNENFSVTLRKVRTSMGAVPMRGPSYKGVLPSKRSTPRPLDVSSPTTGLPCESSRCLMLYMMLHMFPFQLLLNGCMRQNCLFWDYTLTCSFRPRKTAQGCIFMQIPLSVLVFQIFSPVVTIRNPFTSIKGGFQEISRDF